MTKKLFFLFIILTLCLSFNEAFSGRVSTNGETANQPRISSGIKRSVPPVVQGGRGLGKPEYVPSQILVKFKEGKDPQKVLTGADIGIKSIERVHAIKPSIAKFRKDYKIEKTGKGWYSFLGKDYKEIDQIPDEEIFKEACKSMPDAEKSLYRSYKVDLPEGAPVEEAIEKLKNNPDIEYAEPNYRVSIHEEATPISNLPYIPDDYYVRDNVYWRWKSWSQEYPDMYGLRNIKAIEAWNLFDSNHNGVFDDDEKLPGKNVVVAVIDSGVDYNHEDLASNMWINTAEIAGDGLDNDNNGYVDDVRGYDFSSNNNDPSDCMGHGTHCAGTIAAIGNNGIGVIGVAPNVKIMPVKIFPSGDETVCARAIRYAAANGAHILSNSWGFRDRTPVCREIEAAIDYAVDVKGCTVIFSAGNNNDDVAYYSPANYAKTVAVAWTDHNNEKAFYSNWGDLIGVSAPGDDILSLRAHGPDIYGTGDMFVPVNDPNAKYYRCSGTSMACPHVSGLAALIKSYYPSISQAEIRGRILAGADSIDDKNPSLQGLLGSGIINAVSSLTILPSPAFKVLSIDRKNIIPGKSGTVVVTIKNLWQDAAGVRASLETADTRITIRNNNMLLGDIPQGQTKTNGSDPFILDFSPSISFGEKINLVLVLTCQDSYQKRFNFSIEFTFFRSAEGRIALPVEYSYPQFLAASDYNNDGYSDLLAMGAYTYLFKNSQNGSFENVTKSAGVDANGDYHEYSATSRFMDINNDGNEDLFIGVGDYISNQVFLNNGAGAFTDITASSNIKLMMCLVLGVLIDYNNDGFIDVFGSKYPSGLFALRNNGDNTFTDRVRDTGLPLTDIDLMYTEGTSLDYDNDGDQDLLFSGCWDSVKLFRNNGNGTFTDVTARAGMSQGQAEYRGVAVGDYNNDGYEDIFLTGLLFGSQETKHNILYKNNGDGTFTDVTEGAINFENGAAGSSYGTAFFDYDNDGNLDLFMSDSSYNAIGDRVFHNNGDGTFTDVTTSAFPSGIKPSYAPACIMDYNNDGALDVYAPTKNRSGVGAFLINSAGLDKNWIKIKLIGTKSNREAYGAKIYIRTGAVTQLREIHTASTEIQPVHFGLGSEALINEIEVRWPSGIIQKVNNISSNQVLSITESDIDMPTIVSIEPLSVNEGDTVTIRGRNFGTVAGTVQFYNDKTDVTVSSRSDTCVVCNVPAGARSGNITVSSGELKSNGVHINILTPPDSPTDLTATALPLNKVELRWQDNASFEDGFKIERSLGSEGVFEQIAVVNAPNSSTYIDSGLDPETFYRYRICAFIECGVISGYSNIADVTTLTGSPIGPSDLKVQVVSATELKLDWKDNSNREQGFKIERFSGLSGTFVEVATAGTNVTTYSNSGLTPDTMYHYRIRAYSNSNYSPYSNEVYTYTPDLTPAAPTNLSAISLSPASISFTWDDNSSNESGFIIEQSCNPDSGFTETARIMSENVSTYIYKNFNLNQDTNYYYRVCAFSWIAPNSPYSNVVLVPTPPNTPVGLAAAGISSTQVRITWIDNSNSETGFKVFRNDSEVGAVGANVTVYTDADLTPSTSYSYKLLAYNTGGESAKSYAVYGKTKGTKPVTPSDLSAVTVASISNITVRLTWRDNSDNESGFRIERSLSRDSGFVTAKEVSANVTSCEDAGMLDVNTKYYYRVCAYNDVDSDYSNVVEIVTPPERPFPLITVAVSSSQVDLTWQDNSGSENGFNVSRGPTIIGPFTQIATVDANVTTYPDTGLTANTRYYYIVQSYNENGVSAGSNPGVVITLKVKPAAPSDLIATVISSSQVALAWQDNSDNEEGFKIERRQGPDGEFTPIATVAAGVKAYTDKDVPINFTYFYKVSAYNNGGDSACSSVPSVSMNAPSAPSDLAATAASISQIDLVWQDNSDNETGFLIERSLDSGGPFTQIAAVGANVTTYPNTGLSEGTTYYYKIRANNLIGSSEYSNTADMRTLQNPPNPPSQLTLQLALSARSIRLRWLDNSGNEDGFKIQRSLTGQESDFAQIAQVGPGTSPTAPSYITYIDPSLSSGTTYYYRVCAYNGGGQSGWSNIESKTFPVNHPPTIRVDPSGDKSVDENQALSFRIIISDPESIPRLLPVTLPDGAALTNNKILGNIFAWTPSYSQAGAYPLTFTVTDGELTASATVTITVNNVNRPPVIIFNPERPYSVDEGGTLEFDAIFSDPDDDLLHSRTLYDLPEGATFDDNGHFRWKPTYVQSGTYTFTISMSDGELAATEAVPITVNEIRSALGDVDGSGVLSAADAFWVTQYILGTRVFNEEQMRIADVTIPRGAITTLDAYYIVRAGLGLVTLPYENHAPVLTDPGNRKVKPGDKVIIKLSATDPDNAGIPASYASPIYYSAIIPSDMQGASFDTATATFTWTAPAEGGVSYQVTFEASDAELKDAKADTFSVNRPPVLDPIGNKEVREGEKMEFKVQASDPDQDKIGYKIDSVTKISGEPGSGGDNKPKIGITQEGIVSWSPDYTQSGVYDVTISVSDAIESAKQTFRIYVLNTNRAPVLDPIGNKTIKEGEHFNLKITAKDPDGDRLWFACYYPPNGATFNFSGEFDWTPTYKQAGAYTMTFYVMDRDPNSGNQYAVGSETVTITVTNVNRPPVVTPIPDQKINEGTAWTLYLNKYVSDPDGDTLRYSFSADPSKIVPDGLVLTPEGVLTFKPNYNQEGTYTVDLIVSDIVSHPNDSLKTPFSLKIIVISTNSHPEIRSLQNINNTYLAWQGYDKEDLSNLIYSYKVDNSQWSKPTQTTYVYITALIQELKLKPGNNTFTVRAIDTKGAYSIPKSVVFYVKPNKPPEIISLTNISDRYITWYGTDLEDGSNILYSYKVDSNTWSAPSATRTIYISAINVPKGYHTFTVKAIDKGGAESPVKSVGFKK